MKITIRTPYGISEVGKQTINEDALHPTIPNISDQDRLFILCDGKSSRGNGHLASQLVSKAFYTYMTKVNPPKKTVGQLYMNEALRYVERKISQFKNQDPTVRSTSATMVLAYFNEDDSVTIAWVGNSRGYVIRDRKILYKTDDHLDNIWVNGKRQLASRTITGDDPVWISTAVIKDICDDDYIFLCTQGILQALDDRNIKYLLSQGDGTNEVNKGILEKMTNTCNVNSRDNFSSFLIQIETSPNTNNIASVNKPSMPVTIPKQSGSSSSWNTSYTNEVVREKKEPIKLNKKQTSGLALLTLLLLIVISAAAFGYKYQKARPLVKFNQHMDAGNSFAGDGNYEKAILAFEKALQVKNVKDTQGIRLAKEKLNYSKEYSLIQKGDFYYKEDELVKAKMAFEEVLHINSKNTAIKRKVDQINIAVAMEKDRLLATSDSLLQAKNYKDAKLTLYDALYFDQKNEQILALVNNCNQYLEINELSLENAVENAIAKAGGNPIVEQPKVKEIVVPVVSKEDSIIAATAKALAAKADEKRTDEELLEESKRLAEQRAIEQKAREEAEESRREEERKRRYEKEMELERKRQYEQELMAARRKQAEALSRPSSRNSLANNDSRPTSRPSAPVYKRSIPVSDATRSEGTLPNPFTNKTIPNPPTNQLKKKPTPPKAAIKTPPKQEAPSPKTATPSPKPSQPLTSPPPQKPNKATVENKPKPKPKTTPPPQKPKKTSRDTEYHKVQKEAYTAFQKGDFAVARRKFERMLAYKDERFIHDKIAQCKQQIDKQKEYVEVVKKADNDFNKGKYEDAQKSYRQALNFNVKEDYLTKKIEDASKKIVAKQQKDEQASRLKAAQKAFKEENFSVALQKYQSALAKADGASKKEIQNKIAACNREINEMGKNTSRRNVRKAEKYCESNGYGKDSYDYLQKNGLLHSMTPQTLYKIGKKLENTDQNKARECYSIAAKKGMPEAQTRLEVVEDEVIEFDEE